LKLKQLTQDLSRRSFATPEHPVPDIRQIPGCNSAGKFLLISLLWCASPVTSHADITVTDDHGDEIRLVKPAGRIVSLAPNLTELLFAAGAGASIVATVSYSDYPEAARSIPRIGDSYNLDMEAITALQPDLIVLWSSGTGVDSWRKLTGLGFTVYRSEPDTLEKIASTIRKFGRLGGSDDTAEKSSDRLLAQISRLREQYSDRHSVSVFYQFWDKPVFTVNGRHLISHIIALCGGRNIFADLLPLTPQINPEAVLELNPEVIIASGDSSARPAWLEDWKQWTGLAATKSGHLYAIPPELIQRHTPRILEGAARMCEYIDRAR
jgi:iron complex transport system substrate-binding protein